MADTEKLRQRLEGMLKDHLGVSELVTDEEGDYPVRAGSAKYYVRLDDDLEPPTVRVYAHILVGVTATAKLYETLNAVNGHITFGRMFHQGEAVLASTELVAATMDPEELAQSCSSIAGLADEYDDLFKAEFGGSRQFEEEEDNPLVPENTATTA
jgi:hypothetical protein